MIAESLKKAQRVARYANVVSAKVSAIAFSHSGRILAVAHNRRCLSPDPSLNKSDRKWTQHAEEGLINKLNRIKAFSRFEGITILVIRMNKGKMAMAKPCLACQDLLRRYDVEVSYSNKDGEIERLDL